MNDTVNGYKEFKEKKKDIVYARLDASMLKKLQLIRNKTGISVSEIIREGVRRLLADIDDSGTLNLKIN